MALFAERGSNSGAFFLDDRPLIGNGFGRSDIADELLHCWTCGGLEPCSSLRGVDEGRQAGDLQEDMVIHNPWRGQEGGMTIGDVRKGARGEILEQ